MREPKAPTLDELLSEYEKASRRSPDGKTVSEWSEEWKIHTERARKIIGHAIKQGKMIAENARRPCITRPGYSVACTLIRFTGKARK